MPLWTFILWNVTFFISAIIFSERNFINTKTVFQIK